MMLDIQAEIDMHITEEELSMMLLMAAGLHMCHSGKVVKTRQLSRLVFACTYTLSAATMRRGEECYSQKLFRCFTQTIQTIGPAGMNCTFLVCNKAKHNTKGRLAIAPHVDPLMDQSFWHGLLWLYLIMVAGFRFPDFADWQTLFKLPTYPTPWTFTHYSCQQYGLLWSGFFSDAKVHVGKLTHIWRGQGEQELDESGVSIVSIGQMMGHAVESSNKKEGPMKAQSQTYITNPPTDAVVGRAGGNWRNPCEHCLPCEMVVISEHDSTSTRTDDQPSKGPCTLCHLHNT
jgi:hypothetical protein